MKPSTSLGTTTETLNRGADRVVLEKNTGLARVAYKLRKFGRRIRYRARAVGKPSVIWLNGVRIPVEPSSYSEKIIRRLYDESYEADECQALSRTLRRTDRLLELGSGIGYLSSFASKKLRVSHVTACEANPALIPIIARAHAMNRLDAEILHGVMSRDSTRKSCVFYQQREFWSSSLQKPTAGSDPIDVPVFDWQQELDRLKPSYLLMDIEGGEIELLEDFSHPSVERMLIEFHPKVTGEPSIERVFKHLESIGFCAARPHGGTNVWYFERESG